MGTYKYVGRHADVLGNGRPIAPGETIYLMKTKDPTNLRLIENGLLVPLDIKGKPTKSKEDDQ